MVEKIGNGRLSRPVRSGVAVEIDHVGSIRCIHQLADLFNQGPKAGVVRASLTHGGLFLQRNWPLTVAVVPEGDDRDLNVSPAGCVSVGDGADAVPPKKLYSAMRMPAVDTSSIRLMSTNLKVVGKPLAPTWVAYRSLRTCIRLS